MRLFCVTALLMVSGASVCCGQQTAASAPSASPDAQQAKVKVYTAGPGVTAPEMLPLNQLPMPDEKCKKNKVYGKVELFLLVDTTGKPYDIMFINALGSELDDFALKLAAVDRFKPGRFQGIPAVVAQSVEVGLDACVIEKKDDTGKKTYWLQLTSQPTQKFNDISNPPELSLHQSPELDLLQLVENSSKGLSSGNHVVYKTGIDISEPKVLYQPEAEFSDEARRNKIQGPVLVSLIVDAHGMPQNVHVVRHLGYGLDEKAVEAVRQYRFKPAMHNGVPVPVVMKVEVNFQLFLGRY